MKIKGANLGELLKKKRLEAGINQAAVAKITGVRQAQISYWEQGAALPRPKRMEKIKRFLKADERALALLVGKKLNDHSGRDGGRSQLKKGLHNGDEAQETEDDN